MNGLREWWDLFGPIFFGNMMVACLFLVVLYLPLHI